MRKKKPSEKQSIGKYTRLSPTDWRKIAPVARKYPSEGEFFRLAALEKAEAEFPL